MQIVNMLEPKLVNIPSVWALHHSI